MSQHGIESYPGTPPYGSHYSMFPPLTVMNMPMAGEYGAPIVFQGNWDGVKSFLRQYERLATLHNLTDDEKCWNVLDYCNTHTREIIEGLPSFSSKI